MTDRSRGEAESKPNRSDPSGSPPTPHFKPGLVLDAISGAYSDRRGYAHLMLRTIDGTEFECFVDGIVTKGFSDRLLGLAGHMLLQSHGEAADLRPLHELGDDNDDLPPFPEGVAPMALTPFPEPGGADDPGTLDKPPAFHTITPGGSIAGVLPEPTEANGWSGRDDAPMKDSAGYPVKSQ